MRIDIDTCEEILITITRNKTRSLLTAFGVFWGIFMLVALIGGGQGLQDMMQKNFEGFATNSGFLAAQKTGEALVMALDGEAVIGYEGQEQVIHAGETFKFDKFGKHSVSATKQFKMALLLVLE